MPPAPFGTTPIELTSMSPMSVFESTHVTPSLVDLKMPVVAPAANTLTPLAPLGLIAKSSSPPPTFVSAHVTPPSVERNTSRSDAARTAPLDVTSSPWTYEWMNDTLVQLSPLFVDRNTPSAVPA